jgi:hypothetical protein
MLTLDPLEVRKYASSILTEDFIKHVSEMHKTSINQNPQIQGLLNAMQCELEIDVSHVAGETHLTYSLIIQPGKHARNISKRQIRLNYIKLPANKSTHEQAEHLAAHRYNASLNTPFITVIRSPFTPNIPLDPYLAVVTDYPYNMSTPANDEIHAYNTFMAKAFDLEIQSGGTKLHPSHSLYDELIAGLSSFTPGKIMTLTKKKSSFGCNISSDHFQERRREIYAVNVLLMTDYNMKILESYLTQEILNTI